MKKQSHVFNMLRDTRQLILLILTASLTSCYFSNKNQSQLIKCSQQMFTFNLLPFFFAFSGTELKTYMPSGQQSEGQQQILRILGYEFPFSFDKHITNFEKTLYDFNYKHQLDLYVGEYFKIFVIFTIIFILSLVLFTIAYFLSLNTMRDAEKLSQYECGFEPFDEATRHPFDVHFYVVGILFLIFDVEIALLFP
jgi:hypothetical protein